METTSHAETAAPPNYVKEKRRVITLSIVSGLLVIIIIITWLKGWLNEVLLSCLIAPMILSIIDLIKTFFHLMEQHRHEIQEREERFHEQRLLLKEEFESKLALGKHSDIYEEINRLLMRYALGNPLSRDALFKEICHHIYKVLVYFKDRHLIVSIVEAFERASLHHDPQAHFRDATDLAMSFQKRLSTVGQEQTQHNDQQTSDSEKSDELFIEEQLSRLILAMMGLERGLKLIPLQLKFRTTDQDIKRGRTPDGDWHQLRYSIDNCQEPLKELIHHPPANISSGDLLLFWRDVTGSASGGVIGIAKVASVKYRGETLTKLILSERNSVPKWDLIRFSQDEGMKRLGDNVSTGTDELSWQTLSQRFGDCLSLMTIHQQLVGSQRLDYPLETRAPCLLANGKNAVQVRLDINHFYTDTHAAFLLDIFIDHQARKENLSVEFEGDAWSINSFTPYAAHSKTDDFDHLPAELGFVDLDRGHMNLNIAKARITKLTSSIRGVLIMSWRDGQLKLLIEKETTGS